MSNTLNKDLNALNSDVINLYKENKCIQNDINNIRNDTNKLISLFEEIVKNVAQNNKQEVKQEVKKEMKQEAKKDCSNKDSEEENKKSNLLKWVLGGVGVAVAGAAGIYLLTRDSETEDSSIENKEVSYLEDGKNNTLSDNYEIRYSLSNN